MGYCMSTKTSDFRIRKENARRALNAVRKLTRQHEEKGNGGYSFGGVMHRTFSWVDAEDVLNADTLYDALRAWRWELGKADPYEVEGRCDYTSIVFLGDYLGDDNLLFQEIAPFVEDGSFIEMHGDGCFCWRWVFRKGKCREVKGRIVFDEECPPG